MDTSFFVKAFAASPAAVVPGYVIGGIAYFAIPWGLGTLMSSVVLGLENNPIFPTHPRVNLASANLCMIGANFSSECPGQRSAMDLFCLTLQ